MITGKSTTLFVIFLIVLSSFSFKSQAISRDSAARLTDDTSQTKPNRLSNHNFNEIYLQNLRPSSAGNEYFDPNKTLLVADLTANFILLNSPRIPVFFVASARVNLRLLAQKGDPVKSPSYMPGGTVYFRLNNNPKLSRFMSVSYTHHSNGVEGPTLNKNGTFNTDSGKFSTNFYTLTYHAGKRTEKNDFVINRYNAVGLELHSALFGLGYVHPLKNNYGFVRVNGDWLYNISRYTTDPIDKHQKSLNNWQRFDLQLAYIADKYNDYAVTDIRKRLNVVLKYYYQFPFMQNVSFMVGAGYRGQDEYNIFFQDSYAYLTVGLAAGLSFSTHRNQ